MKIWKRFALGFPKIYLLMSWTVIGLLGMALNLRQELIVLCILFFGYFANIIWMMRQSQE